MTTTSMHPTDEPQQMTARAWGLLLVICGALFLEGIDIAMLNVAVPAIAADVGLEAGAAHWVVSAYVLGYAGFLLLGGRVADAVGRRRVFLAALAVFVLFSAVGGLADTSWLIVVARFMTGVAAGFLAPAGFGIVSTSFPSGPLRDRAMVVYGAVGAAGFTLGMVAGGMLTTASWRWVFFAPVVVGVVLLVVGNLLIRPDEPRVPTGAAFDFAGAFTATGGMVSVVYAVVTVGEERDLGKGLVAVTVAALLLAGFIIAERRAAAPLLPLHLLRQGLLPLAAVAGLLFMGAFLGFQFAATLYLQELRGWSPLETGLTFAIMGLDLVLAPVLTPLLVRRYGNLRVMVAGLVSAAAAYAWMLRLRADWTYVDLLPTLLLVAVAFALVYGPLTLAATEDVPEEQHGVAGGVVFTAFQFGGALGLALVAIALAKETGQAGVQDYQRAMTVPAIAAGVAVLVGLVALTRNRAETVDD